MRNLEGDARSVAGALIGADSAAVFELAQGRQGLIDDLMVGVAAVADDEREAAGIMFECRIVEPVADWVVRRFRVRLVFTVHRCLYGV